MISDIHRQQKALRVRWRLYDDTLGQALLLLSSYPHCRVNEIRVIHCQWSANLSVARWSFKENFMLTMVGPFQAGAGKLLSSWLAIVMPSLIKLPLAPGPEAQRHHFPLSNDTRTIHIFGIFNVDIIFPLPSYVLSLYYESCYVRFHLTWFFFSFATPPCQWPLIQAYRKYPPNY